MPEDLCEGWEAAQIADPDLRTVRRYVEQRIMPSGHERKTLSDGVTRLLRQHKRLCIKGGVLCRKVIDPNTHELNCQIVCPASRHLEVWRRHHEAAAHAGAERTLSSLRRHFFWTDMDKEVRGFQSGCTTCSIQKDRTEPRAPLCPIEVTYPLEVVALDFLSLSRPSDTYQNILVMTDMFTRYAWAVPTRDQTAKTTVRTIWSHIIQTFGCPARFHSDQGPNFESDLMKQLCDLYGISKSRTTPYHPAGNGRAERMNQTLLNMLRTLEAEKQNKWPEHLPELLQAYNNTVHSSTGFAPSYLMFGRHLRLPVDVGLGTMDARQTGDLGSWVRNHHQKLTYAYDLARRKMEKAAERTKQRYDRRADAAPLLVGERVWVRNRNRKGQGKLHGGWDPEPQIILETVGETGLLYKVRPERGGKEKVLHRNALKLCTAPQVQTPVAKPREENQTSVPTFYYIPDMEQTAVDRDEGEVQPRRSARQNIGQPPARYRT
uniref:Gypsy retrotransposon integrase-like protein 1 n=1 Tax=Myripristis murdjan TaxID=586833 RepID=A0A667W970_9TELE